MFKFRNESTKSIRRSSEAIAADEAIAAARAGNKLHGASDPHHPTLVYDILTQLVGQQDDRMPQPRGLLGGIVGGLLDRMRKPDEDAEKRVQLARETLGRIGNLATNGVVEITYPKTGEVGVETVVELRSPNAGEPPHTITMLTYRLGGTTTFEDEATPGWADGGLVGAIHVLARRHGVAAHGLSETFTLGRSEGRDA